MIMSVMYTYSGLFMIIFLWICKIFLKAIHVLCNADGLMGLAEETGDGTLEGEPGALEGDPGNIQVDPDNTEADMGDDEVDPGTEEVDPGTEEVDPGTVDAEAAPAEENLPDGGLEEVEGGYAGENMNKTAEIDASHNVTSPLSENAIESGKF